MSGHNPKRTQLIHERRRDIYKRLLEEDVTALEEVKSITHRDENYFFLWQGDYQVRTKISVEDVSVPPLSWYVEMLLEKKTTEPNQFERDVVRTLAVKTPFEFFETFIGISFFNMLLPMPILMASVYGSLSKLKLHVEFKKESLWSRLVSAAAHSSNVRGEGMTPLEHIFLATAEKHPDFMFRGVNKSNGSISPLSFYLMVRASSSTRDQKASSSLVLGLARVIQEHSSQRRTPDMDGKLMERAMLVKSLSIIQAVSDLLSKSQKIQEITNSETALYNAHQLDSTRTKVKRKIAFLIKAIAIMEGEMRYVQ